MGSKLKVLQHPLHLEYGMSCNQQSKAACRRRNSVQLVDHPPLPLYRQDCAALAYMTKS